MSGGNQPANISVLNRRYRILPLLMPLIWNEKPPVKQWARDWSFLLDTVRHISWHFEFYLAYIVTNWKKNLLNSNYKNGYYFLIVPISHLMENNILVTCDFPWNIYFIFLWDNLHQAKHRFHPDDAERCCNPIFLPTWRRYDCEYTSQNHNRWQ